MTKIFLLNANAPITPSNEKLASKTSKYKNNDNQTLCISFIPHFEVCSIFAIPSMKTKTTVHRILAIRKGSCSLLGRNVAMV